MAFYKYFWNLANSTDYQTHTVGSFDANCTTGGGVFRWVPSVNNFSVPNIPGIRIKPSASSVGYWERVWSNSLEVAWFGCQNTETAPLTFAEMGISQAVLNQRYGTNFALTTDNYDTTAIRYALQYMGTFGQRNTLSFEPKTYWLTRVCELPVKYQNAQPYSMGMFIIDGMGATIKNATSTSFDFFSRVPVSQTDATQNYINHGFTFQNFSANGAGSPFANSGKSFLFLSATTNSIIRNINLQNFDLGLRLEYCQSAEISNISTSAIKTTSIFVKNGSWTGASIVNAGSDNTTMDHLWVYDTLSQQAAVKVIASNNCEVKHLTLNGTGTPQYGILFDSLGSSSVFFSRTQDNRFKIATSVAAIYFKQSNKGRHIVDGAINEVAQNLVGAEAYSGDPDIYLANIPFWQTGTKLLDVLGSTWELYNVRFGAGITTAANVVNPSNNLWDLVPNDSIIPNVSLVRYTPPIAV